MSAATLSASPSADILDDRRPARVGEIILLILALAIGLLAYAQVGWSNGGKLPPNFATVAGCAAGAAFLAHLAVRLLAPYSDQVLLPVAFAINGLGLALIYRLDVASAVRAANNNQSAPHDAFSVSRTQH